MLTGKRLILCKEAKISVRLNSAHTLIHTRTGIELFRFQKKETEETEKENDNRAIHIALFISD